MSYQDLTADNGQLLLQLKQGDQIAFEEIFNRFSDPVYTYIKCRLNNSQEADDVFQEVFIRLWDKRKKINIHTSFRNYFYTIVQHCIADHLRAAKRKGYALTEELPECTESSIQPDLQYQHKEAYSMWKGAVNTLPGKMRQIYSLKNDEELSIKEIASELELSEQTVKNQLHNAGQRIIRFMKQVQVVVCLL